MTATILDYKQTAQSAACAAEITKVLAAAGCESTVAQTLRAGADFAVVLGGDGAMIRAAKSAIPFGIPIIGVNMGRVGYLAELEPQNVDRLAEVVRGAYFVEPRMLLTVTDMHGNTYEALNDVVVANARGARISALSLSCNGSEVGDYLADGLLFATPTGSTAYSMSAGGAVIDPALECICVTPICSVLHRAKPMVFAANASFELKNASDAEEVVSLTIDGASVGTMAQGETIRVQRAANHARILRLEQGGFFQALKRKMQV